MNAFICITGLIAGQFIFQWLQDLPNWMVAVDRSFFQTFAILWYVGYSLFKTENGGPNDTH